MRMSYLECVQEHMVGAESVKAVDHSGHGLV